jgi:HCOMODA/2-hydroxy-3-carboxy-muconic semialdehyde decarboxylase
VTELTSSPATTSARQLRVAARALARAGLVHAYGHCSVRMNADTFLVSPSKPLGLVRPGDELITVRTTGPLPLDVLGEVIVHQGIYRERADVGAIARFQSPHITALSTLGLTPRARHGFGAYFAPCPPLFSDPRLVRDGARAASLVRELAGARAIVMRGNGAVAVGATLEEAVVMAWYLEDAARVELAVRGSGLAGLELDAEEARDRAVTTGKIIERMWDWLTAGDAELPGAVG